MRDRFKMRVPWRSIRRGLNKVILTVLLSILAIVFLFPLLLTIADSFMSEQEIVANYSMIVSDKGSVQDEGSGEKFANLKLIPDRVTLKQYYTVLVKRIQFLVMFWNSVKVALSIILGQITVSAMAAYAFAKIEFRGREKLFFLYIIVMLMPFQVTLVPNYIVADKLGLVGNYLSIILPGVFSTFGVFLLRQFMVYIPDAYAESAKIDGANHWDIFTKIIMPMTKTGIAALAILVFIDSWNMVEQPLIFLKDVNQQPLSTFLSSINSGERGIAFAASTIYMVPMLLVFLYGENYLVEGIQLSGLKG